MNKAKFKVGDVVYYSSFIGEQSTDAYEIDTVQPEGIPSHTRPVYWLKGKAGCVSEDALSPAPSLFLLSNFFGAVDEEELTWTEPDEYIDDLYQNGCPLSQTLGQWLDEACPLTVYGWTRKRAIVRISEVDRLAEIALLDFADELIEEYGNPEDEQDFWTKEEADAIRAKIVEAFTLGLSTMFVWQCEQTTSREYSRDEVEEILKGHGYK